GAITRKSAGNIAVTGASTAVIAVTGAIGAVVTSVRAGAEIEAIGVVVVTGAVTAGLARGAALIAQIEAATVGGARGTETASGSRRLNAFLVPTRCFEIRISEFRFSEF